MAALGMREDHRPHDPRTTFITMAKRAGVDEYVIKLLVADAQFAGSSSVPAHVEMMGLIGMGNNPMVGATVAVAVLIEEAAKAGKF